MGLKKVRKYREITLFKKGNAKKEKVKSGIFCEKRLFSRLFFIKQAFDSYLAMIGIKKFLFQRPTPVRCTKRNSSSTNFRLFARRGTLF